MFRDAAKPGGIAILKDAEGLKIDRLSHWLLELHKEYEKTDASFTKIRHLEKKLSKYLK